MLNDLVTLDPAPAPDAARPERAPDPTSPAELARLRAACRSFEGVFLGILFKEGLKLSEPEEGQSAIEKNGLLQDYALEEMARYMGENESTGIARMM